VVSAGACRVLVMLEATAGLYAPIPSSCIEKCEKYRHLKYVKTSVDEKQVLKNK